MVIMKIPFLFIAALAIFLPAEMKDYAPIRKKGYCVWYERCPARTGYVQMPPLNCLYNGPAKTLNDTKGIQLLNDLCPQFAADRKTCCSTRLLTDLKSTWGYISRFSKHCPACHQNVMNLFCQLICSPDQSLFMKPERVINHKSNKEITQISYYVPSEFKKTLFDSCKHVLHPRLKRHRLLDRLCDNYVARCTPQKLFKRMGSITSGHYSFSILFPEILPQSMNLVNVKAYRCNESFVNPWNNKTMTRCNCASCLHSCPRPTPGPKAVRSHSLTHKKGYCIWYDRCQSKNYNSWASTEYCLYNGPARTLNDTKGIQLLQKICPNFAANRKTCCSAQLLDDLLHNIYYAVFTLAKDCPSCRQNLMTMYCEFVCSPDQSLFTAPQMIKDLKSEALITQMNYYVSPAFKKGLFDSCKDVIVPYSVTNKILDTRFLCGQKPETCTPQKLVENMGRKESGNYPNFEILFPECLPQKMTWMNKVAYKCNSVFTTPWNKTSASCKCRDCASSCPTPTPT